MHTRAYALRTVAQVTVLETRVGGTTSDAKGGATAGGISGGSTSTSSSTGGVPAVGSGDASDVGLSATTSAAMSEATSAITSAIMSETIQWWTEPLVRVIIEVRPPSETLSPREGDEASAAFAPGDISVVDAPSRSSVGVSESIVSLARLLQSNSSWTAALSSMVEVEQIEGIVRSAGVLLFTPGIDSPRPLHVQPPPPSPSKGLAATAIAHSIVIAHTAGKVAAVAGSAAASLAGKVSACEEVKGARIGCVMWRARKSVRVHTQ